MASSKIMATTDTTDTQNEKSLEKADADVKVDQAAEKPAASKEVTSVCTVDLGDVFGSLHKKAEEQIKSAFSDFTVVNSSIEGKGAKVKFVGSGQHIILAIPDNISYSALNENKSFKDSCFNVIKTYVQWFCGPDNANSELSKDALIPQTQKLTEEDKEFIAKNPEASAKEEPTDQPTDDTKKDGEDTNEPDADASGEDTEDKKTPVESRVFRHPLLTRLFESTQEEDFALAAESDEKVVGYYITFTIDIGGKQKSTLDSAWKRLGKSIGSILGDTKFEITGLTRKDTTVSVNDIAKGFKTKTLDPDKFKSAFDTNFKKKFSSINMGAAVIDTPSLIAVLTSEDNSRLTNPDIAMLRTAENALVIKIDANNEASKIVSKQAIVDLVNTSMETSGFGTLLNTNAVKKSGVIFINNFDLTPEKKRAGDGSTDDAIRVSSTDVKAKPSWAKPKGKPKESYSGILWPHQEVLLEVTEGQPDGGASISATDIQKELETQSKAEFGDALVSVTYNKTSEILADLKAKKVDVSSLTASDTTENSFLIIINPSQLAAKESMHTDKKLLSLLFEADDKDETENLKIATTIFQTTINNVAKNAKKKIEADIGSPEVFSFTDKSPIAKDAAKLQTDIKQAVTGTFKESVMAGIFELENFKTIAAEKRMAIATQAIKTKYVIGVRLGYAEAEASNILTEDYKIDPLSGREKSKIVGVATKFADIIKTIFGESIPGKIYKYRKHWAGENSTNNKDTLFIFAGTNKYDTLASTTAFLLPDSNNLVQDNEDGEDTEKKPTEDTTTKQDDSKSKENTEEVQLDKRKSGYDCFIIPMKNLKYEDTPTKDGA